MAAMRDTELELTSHSAQPSTAALTDTELLQNTENDPSLSTAGFSLPPTDGGKDAWLCLFACFMLEALIWGTVPHIGLMASTDAV